MRNGPSIASLDDEKPITYADLMSGPSRRNRLLSNLAFHLLGMFTFHSAVFAVLAIRFALAFSDVLAFSAVLFIHHLLIMLILSNMLEYFVHTRDGSALYRINIPIFITLIRITSLPAIVFLIILMPTQPVLPALITYVAVAFISDFLDGNISRRLKETTKIGAYLDSMSDYAVLISISIAYIIFDLLPDWFFVLVMSRLFFQWAAAGVLTIIHGRITPHHSSILAKTSIFLIMAAYGIALLQFIPSLQSAYPMIALVTEAVVAPVLALSLIEKVIGFISEIRHGVEGQNKKDGDR
jgi:cardiolipin synthase